MGEAGSHDTFFAAISDARKTSAAWADDFRQQLAAIPDWKDRKAMMQFEVGKLINRSKAMGQRMDALLQHIGNEGKFLSPTNWANIRHRFNNVAPLYMREDGYDCLSLEAQQWHDDVPHATAVTLLSNGESYYVNREYVWRRYGEPCKLIRICTPPEFPPFGHVLVCGWPLLTFLNDLEPHIPETLEVSHG